MVHMFIHPAFGAHLYYLSSVVESWFTTLRGFRKILWIIALDREVGPALKVSLIGTGPCIYSPHVGPIGRIRLRHSLRIVILHPDALMYFCVGLLHVFRSIICGKRILLIIYRGTVLDSWFIWLFSTVYKCQGLDEEVYRDCPGITNNGENNYSVSFYPINNDGLRKNWVMANTAKDLLQQSILNYVSFT